MTPTDRDALLLLTARLALRLAEHPCDFTSGVELRRMLETIDAPRARYANQAALGPVAAPKHTVEAENAPAPGSAPPGWLAKAWGTWRTGRSGR